MGIRYSSVNFDNGGLSTVGFALYNFDGTLKTARSTTNVVELGTSSGIYAASFTVDDGWNGMVLWDDGESTPTYAQDHQFATLNQVTETNDKIRIIWNTLKNRADFEGEVLMKIKSVYESIGKIKDPSDIMKEMFMGYEGEKVSVKDDFDKLSNELIMISGKSNDIMKSLDSLKPKKNDKSQEIIITSINELLSNNHEKSIGQLVSLRDNLSSQMESVVSSDYGKKLSLLLSEVNELKTNYHAGFKTLVEQLEHSITKINMSTSDKNNIQTQLRTFLELLNTLTSMQTARMSENNAPVSDEILKYLSVFKKRGK